MTKGESASQVEQIRAQIEQLRAERALIDNKLSVMETNLVEEVMKEEALWDSKKVAAYFGVTRMHLDTLRKSGKIRWQEIGSSIRFDPAEVRNYGKRGRAVT
jgi:hypothetical protein